MEAFMVKRKSGSGRSIVNTRISIHMVRALAIFPLLGSFGGCSAQSSGSDSRGTDPNSDPECVAGDPSKTPELEIVYKTNDGQALTAEDGASIPLLAAPQGGRIMLIGVRA